MRLIDADALLLYCLNRYNKTIIPSDIKIFPTINLKFVLCKECKFYHDKGYCTKITGLTRIKPDDYCSYGERKDND